MKLFSCIPSNNISSPFQQFWECIGPYFFQIKYNWFKYLVRTSVGSPLAFKRGSSNALLSVKEMPDSVWNGNFPAHCDLILLSRKIKVWDLQAALDPRAPASTLCLRTLVVRDLLEWVLPCVGSWPPADRPAWALHGKASAPHSVPSEKCTLPLVWSKPETILHSYYCELFPREC